MTESLRPLVSKVICVLACLGGLVSSVSVAQTIVWTDVNGRRVQRKDVNGGEIGTILQFQSPEAAGQIHYDPVDAKLYYVFYGSPNSFQRANLDGSDPENIPTPSIGAFTLNVELRKLYWLDPVSHNVFHRSELDGSGVESHTYPSCCITTLEALGGDLFIGAGGAMLKGIWRADPDGSNEQFLFSNPQALDLAYDPVENKLFVADIVEIFRMNLDGTDAESVVLLRVDPVVVDGRGRKVYWTDREAKVIQRSNLDGSNVEDFVTASHVGDPNFEPAGLTIVYGSTPVPDPNGAKGRALSFYVPPPTPSGPLDSTAIRLSMVTLQEPVPPNAPCCPPPDFSAYESATCTALGESNECARWVGRPGTFYESQGPPVSGPYKAARLQCTPLYFDWVTETSGSPINIVGGEIVPSSSYTIQTYGESCMGSETGCTDVSAPLTMTTRRSGDLELPFNPPSTTGQPDVTDVAQLVNKFKNLLGAPVKARSQLQPNLPELNADINALDIVAVVDAVKQRAYAFSGPCPCPSTVTCASLACSSTKPCVTAFGAGATCVKTCSGPGSLADEPCINNSHCTGSGTCGSGFCRDRCGRCSP